MSHEFTLLLRSGEGLQGEVTPDGVPLSVPFAVPKEFGGPGGAWTPEHFFAAAVGSCIAATFLSMARQSKLDVAGYESKIAVRMDKTEKGLRMTRVDVLPRVRVRSESDRERAERMLRKAEGFCPISNSVTSEVHLEPTIEVG